ncbi:CAP domain-containing protein [Halothermothrix orenii]|uniref:SCP-like extracellular n=1 Tax=Halothermothrix orenii (strain H 168 / OCM 544 / DSM 9562) TaxID=373903 RepID=B8D245_HALOH|nr:CAP domain-containing protein [Halothermothrix orenii]ACL69272.1 SCP-like extracellular [Halothermothrix orenii H 168]
MRKLKILIPLILAVLLVSCANESPTQESSIFQIGEVEYCRVTDDNVNVKAGAGNTFPNIATLNKGDIVKVMGEMGNWYVVRLDNNQVGCINTTDATPVVRDGGEPEKQRRIVEPEPAPEAKDDVAPAKSLTSMEQRMVNLINQERRKNNLKPLEVHMKLTEVARIKSQDMVDNNYFSHYSPTYGSPFDMMDRFGIEYLHAAENIAANRSVDDAHESLMRSSGHRRNILNPNFTHVGVGIKPSDKYGYIFTQMFISRPQ